MLNQFSYFNVRKKSLDSIEYLIVFQTNSVSNSLRLALLSFSKPLRLPPWLS
jgi:hypothetical protein